MFDSGRNQTNKKGFGRNITFDSSPLSVEITKQETNGPVWQDMLIVYSCVNGRCKIENQNSLSFY